MSEIVSAERVITDHIMDSKWRCGKCSSIICDPPDPDTVEYPEEIIEEYGGAVVCETVDGDLRDHIIDMQNERVERLEATNEQV